TLTHNDDTDWADSATGERAHGGVTRFGEEVVRELNRCGMLVDLSHTSEDTMRAAITLSEAPVLFSHSNARSLCDVPRNVLEDVSRYPALFEELRDRGYSDEDLARVAGRNVLRVLREAERVGSRLRTERPPSTAAIEQLDG